MTRIAPWLVLAALVLVYPAITLSSGVVRFPSPEECVKPAKADGDIDAVFGYFDSVAEAEELRDRAVGVGFVGTNFGWNACGRLRVSLSGIPTLEIGRQFVEEARNAGFDVTLEQGS